MFSPGVSRGRDAWLPIDGLTVHVVDDDPETVSSLAIVLGDLRLRVQRHADGESLLRRDPEPLAVLLFGARMTGLVSAREMLGQLRTRDRLPPAIGLMTHADVSAAVALMRAGAIDVLQKPLDIAVVTASVRLALQVALESHWRRCERRRWSDSVARLTERERSVAEKIAAGLTNKQVAAELGVSQQAVSANRARACRKLGVDSVAALVRSWVRHEQRDGAEPWGAQLGCPLHASVATL